MIRTWVFLILWILLVCVLVVFFAFVTIPQGWVDNPAFRGLPAVLITVAIVLGAVFSQSRVVFICILTGIAAFLVELQSFSSPDLERARMTMFLASIYVPLLSLIFYHLQERGVLNRHGMSRMAIVGSAVIVMVFLPEVEMLRNGLIDKDTFLFAPISDAVRIPLFGVLVFAVATPVFLLRSGRESPMLGTILLFGVLFFMAALNHDSTLWGANRGHTAFVLCFAVSSAAFAFSVMESSWRNANMDELTELPSRRAMKHRFAGLGQRYAIAVLDIDHFKKVNDRYGHDTGDQVLRFVASFLKRLPGCKGYRYGGEEFVIICEGISNEAVFSRMDDLRKAIASRKFIVRGNDRPKNSPDASAGRRTISQNRGVTITVSIGIATAGDVYYTPNEVFDAADGALYKAKRSGRNCVKVMR